MVSFGVEFVPGDLFWRTTYYAVQAEKLGFNRIWITDHFNNRNVYVTLALVSTYTSRIGLGPGVTNPYLIHPVMTAQAVASLNEVAPGRIACGIGAGDKTTLDMVGVEQKKPLAALREAVAIIRGLTSGAGAEFKGEVFTITRGARLRFRVENPIPIYIGAQGPRMLALAAEVGDGVLINASHPRDIEEATRHVRTAAEAKGRNPKDLAVVAYTSFSVAEDPARAKEAVTPVVAYIVAGCPEVVLNRHGIALENAVKIRDAIVAGKFKDAFSSVTDEMIEAFSISGTPNACVEKVSQLFKTGVTELVTGSPIGPRIRRSMNLIGSEVIPHFKEMT
ncbi:MAG: 5,10-methylenetetrahydromethanopterin reductase [Candidatus Bathyarchaeia archaeon]